MLHLSGLFAPIPTPFYQDERIHLEMLEENLVKWIASPLDGVVMPGSNSEAPYLTDEERNQVWQVCQHAFYGSHKIWIAGTGAETTAATIRYTHTAAGYGAAAALILPPFYYKQNMTHEALLTHYRAVADQSTVPVLLYNMPAYTGIDFELKTLVALAEHPNIIGMKDSSSNVVKMERLLCARPHFQVFAGTGSTLLPYLIIGAIGGIMALANFAAAPLRKVYELSLQGNLNEARATQLSLVEINAAVTTSHGVPGLKYAMDQCGFFGGSCRKPLLPPSTQACLEIDHLLERLRLVHSLDV